MNSLGEDALNVIGAEVTLTATVFADTASDAFDGDFTRGRIADCRFLDIAGDAIDVSGSTMLVTRVDIRRVGDKAISAGEKSTIEVSAVTVVQGRMGLVSKDDSVLRADDVEIRDTAIGLAAYIKKPGYGPATIEAGRVVFSNVPDTAIVQTACRITVGGVAQPTRELDVEALYASTNE